METGFAPRWLGALTSASDQARLRRDTLRVAGLVEQLWQRRVELPIGGVAVPALDRVSTVLVPGHDQLGALARDQRAESHIDHIVSLFRCFAVSHEPDDLGTGCGRDASESHDPHLHTRADASATAFLRASAGRRAR